MRAAKPKGEERRGEVKKEVLTFLLSSLKLLDFQIKFAIARKNNFYILLGKITYIQRWSYYHFLWPIPFFFEV